MDILIFSVLFGGVLVGTLFDWGDDSDDSSSTDTGGTGSSPGTEDDPFANATKLTNGDNTNNGGVGNDIIKARGGDDTVNGNSGQDVIFGNGGTDELFGGGGHDLLIGDEGRAVNGGNDMRDVLKGGNGNDILIGNGGDDGLFGGTGNDMLLAGFGDDRMFGSNGEDTLEGQRGADFVRGGLGNDIVSGNMLYKGLMTAEEAYDLLYDPDVTTTADIERLGDIQQRDDLQADTVYGDDGNDILFLGDSDTGKGGTGDDTFFISPESGTNKATIVGDFVQGQDAIVLQYSGDTAPTFTLGDDGNGNATITVNGTIVATVNGMGGTLTSAEITLRPV